MASRRGALIVLEGCDKAGKSTHVRLLQEALSKLGKPVQLLSFPDRTTAIGQMIDKYLRSQAELQDEAIHLLFSANRWELLPRINRALLAGESVVLDRYAFSGVAFSSAKGLNLDWCKNPDIGLPKPDAVIFLNLSKEDAAGRPEFGEERYENMEFQDKVKHQFLNELKDDSYWKVVETNRPIETVHEEILKLTLQAIDQSQDQPLKGLWTDTQSQST